MALRIAWYDHRHETRSEARFPPFALGSFAEIAFVLGIFYLRGELKNWHLNDDQGRIWEIVLKAIAGLLAISGAIVAVLKYLDDKAAAARKYQEDTAAR